MVRLPSPSPSVPITIARRASGPWRAGSAAKSSRDTESSDRASDATVKPASWRVAMSPGQDSRRVHGTWRRARIVGRGDQRTAGSRERHPLRARRRYGMLRPHSCGRRGFPGRRRDAPGRRPEQLRVGLRGSAGRGAAWRRGPRDAGGSRSSALTHPRRRQRSERPRRRGHPLPPR